jgi:hypothetical protein
VVIEPTSAQEKSSSARRPAAPREGDAGFCAEPAAAVARQADRGQHRRAKRRLADATLLHPELARRQVRIPQHIHRDSITQALMPRGDPHRDVGARVS